MATVSKHKRRSQRNSHISIPVDMFARVATRKADAIAARKLKITSKED